MDPEERPEETVEDGLPERTRRIREAQEAHGGRMAPSLVDETGHPVEARPAPAAE